MGFGGGEAVEVTELAPVAAGVFGVPTGAVAVIVAEAVFGFCGVVAEGGGGACEEDGG